MKKAKIRKLLSLAEFQAAEQEHFDAEFVWEEENGPGTMPWILFAVNGDGSRTIASPNRVKDFLFRSHERLLERVVGKPVKP